jgi:hypothetical protein
MMDQKLALKIIQLKEEDLALRDLLIQRGLLHQGYNEEMAALHNKNAAELDEIINQIDYPTVDKVGKEANEAAWLIIQHSIGKPDFMKKCLHKLKSEPKKDNVIRLHIAYLTDRILCFQDQPQLYGTQFDWDQNGKLSPNPYDDIHLVNQRRLELGLNTLEEQTQIIRKRAQKEKQRPPEDLEQRTIEIDQWKRKVGWKS